MGKCVPAVLGVAVWWAPRLGTAPPAAGWPGPSCTLRGWSDIVHALGPDPARAAQLVGTFWAEAESLVKAQSGEVYSWQGDALLVAYRGRPQRRMERALSTVEAIHAVVRIRLEPLCWDLLRRAEAEAEAAAQAPGAGERGGPGRPGARDAEAAAVERPRLIRMGARTRRPAGRGAPPDPYRDPGGGRPPGRAFGRTGRPGGGGRRRYPRRLLSRWTGPPPSGRHPGRGVRCWEKLGRSPSKPLLFRRNRDLHDLTDRRWQ